MGVKEGIWVGREKLKGVRNIGWGFVNGMEDGRAEVVGIYRRRGRI